MSTIIAAGAGLTVVRGLRSGMHGWIGWLRGEVRTRTRTVLGTYMDDDDGTMESPMGSNRVSTGRYGRPKNE